MRRMAPLPASFMLLSILGLLISGTYTLFGKLSPSWGTAFLLVFALMFIASVLSITPRTAGKPEPSMAAMRPMAKAAVRRPKRAAPKRRRAARKTRKRRR